MGSGLGLDTGKGDLHLIRSGWIGVLRLDKFIYFRHSYPVCYAYSLLQRCIMVVTCPDGP